MLVVPQLNVMVLLEWLVKRCLKDGFYELLKKDNFSKGIIAKEGLTGLIVDIYIFVGYGIKISEVVFEVQKKVKYVLERTLDVM